MDTVEFFKSVNRLCKNQSGCAKCPIWEKGMCMARFGDYSVKNIEETISKVEQWAKDNPIKTRKTRQSEFLKMFPNAHKSGRVLDICPQTLNIEYMPPKMCENISCSACKKDYWNEEVTDND